MIPKKIHYCWVGGNPLPESAKKFIKSWKKYCPDYEIIEWNETNYDFTKIPYMKEAYEAKKWGFVPDYARLDIIYHHGGIYLDTDVQMIKSFDDLLVHSAFAGFEDGPEMNMNLGLGFGSEAGHPAIKALMDSYQDMHFVNPDGSLNMIASPKLNTDALVEYGLIRSGERQEVLGMQIFPKDYFAPKSFVTGLMTITCNTYSIHQYDGSWLSEESQKMTAERWKKHKKKAIKKRITSSIHKMLNLVISEDTYLKVRSIFLHNKQ